MNRRNFLSAALMSSSAIGIAAQDANANKSSLNAAGLCVPALDFVSAEATEFSHYEHYHLLSIPVSVLISIPNEGFKVRTSTLDQGSLNEQQFLETIKKFNLPEGLRTHSHEVSFSREELGRIADGETNVRITVLTPKGNLAHRFYFTASPAALAKIKKARS